MDVEIKLRTWLRWTRHAGEQEGRAWTSRGVFETPVRPTSAGGARQLAAAARRPSTKNRARCPAAAEAWRQKGTGRARQGTTRRPSGRAAARVRPVPRGHPPVPKKMRRRPARPSPAGEAAVVVDALSSPSQDAPGNPRALGLAMPVRWCRRPRPHRAPPGTCGGAHGAAGGLNVYDALRPPAADQGRRGGSGGREGGKVRRGVRDVIRAPL